MILTSVVGRSVLSTITVPIRLITCTARKAGQAGSASQRRQLCAQQGCDHRPPASALMRCQRSGSQRAGLKGAQLAGAQLAGARLPAAAAHLHALAHAPKDGVLAVKPRRWRQCDEELRRWRASRRELLAGQLAGSSVAQAAGRERRAWQGLPTWLPLVSGPELAMLRMPAPVCLSSRVISSSNLPP
jgi:hypothetical protein